MGDGTTDDDSDSAIDDGCPSMLYAYDPVNRLISQTDALGNVWEYDYDEAGRLDTRTDPKSQATAYAYNLRNQLTAIDYPVGTTDVTFDYDDLGNRTEMVDATGTTTYDYDALDRLETVTFPGSRTVGYTYDAVGNRASVTYAGGSDSVDYAYDEAGNLVSVTDWDSDETTYDYDDAGLLEHANLPNGVVGTYSYDDADRLTGIHWVKGANTLAYVDYTLDDAGNRTQRVDGLGTHTYAYDDLYRLTSVTYPGPDDVDYTYDAVGNRLTLVDSNGTTDYDYDGADRLTSVDPPSASPVTYTWDDNGNLTARGSDSFAWDAEDRMTSATVSSLTTTFAYNGDGLRDSLTVNSNTTTFTWDVNTSIPQVLDDEDFRYVYGLGRIAQVGADTHYYLTDGLGSTMALTDDTGAVVNTYAYDVFGAERASTGSQANAFTFAGEQVDASTGLQYLRARFYDTETGRFSGRDSFSGMALDPVSLNRYIYVVNSPTLLTDPLGLCGISFSVDNAKDCAKGAVKEVKHVANRAANTVAKTVDKGFDCLTDISCSSAFSRKLDVLALGLSSARAFITNGFTIAGCVAGALPGCLLGKFAGELVTAPTLGFVSNVLSVGSTVVSCVGSFLGNPKEGGGFTSHNAMSCGASIAITALGAFPEANVDAGAALWQYCRDDRRCPD
jgi:RHS repeat-associated protein